MSKTVPFVYSPIFLFREEENNEAGMLLKQMPLVFDGCQFALPALPDPEAADYALQWDKQYLYGCLFWLLLIKYIRDSYQEFYDLTEKGICVLAEAFVSWQSVVLGGLIEKSPVVLGVFSGIAMMAADRDSSEWCDGLDCNGWNEAVRDLFEAKTREEAAAVFGTLKANLLQWYSSRAFHVPGMEPA